MTKKQFVLSAFVAAIPAFLLIAVVVLSLMDSASGILTDGAKPSIALWVAFVGSAIGALVMGVLPFAVMIFPGLYPVAAVSAPSGPVTGGGSLSQGSGEDDGAEAGGLEDEFGGDEFADEFAEDAEAEEEPAPAVKGKKKK